MYNLRVFDIFWWFLEELETPQKTWITVDSKVFWRFFGKSSDEEADESSVKEADESSDEEADESSDEEADKKKKRTEKGHRFTDKEITLWMKLQSEGYKVAAMGKHFPGRDKKALQANCWIL